MILHPEIYSVQIEGDYFSKTINSLPEQPDQSLRPITAGIIIALHNGASQQTVSQFSPFPLLSVKVSQ